MLKNAYNNPNKLVKKINSGISVQEAKFRKLVVKGNTGKLITAYPC